MSAERAFTYTSARSGSLVLGIVLVLVSEGIGVHLWMYSRNRLAAYFFLASTISVIVWLIDDYLALGRGAITIDDERLHLQVGRRFSENVLRAQVADVKRPTWRDLPQRGMPEAADYLHLMRQATPNVLLTLSEPITVKMPLGRSRQIRRIGLHVDDPDGFVTACSAPG